MKHFECNEQIIRGFSRTSWQISYNSASCQIIMDCGTCTAGLEPSARQHA